MNNEMNEIKEANRKALPKFIIIMIVAAIVGGVIGFLSAIYEVEDYTVLFKILADAFGTNVAPWLLLILAIGFPIASGKLLIDSKKLLQQWDGENEEISEAADEKLSIAIWMAGISIILDMFLFAASYSAGKVIFEDENVLKFWISIISFLAVLIEVIVVQQKGVDMTKLMYPEKTASVYDSKFNEKWMDSCDEAEKILIGRCAYKAFVQVNKVCTILTVVLTLAAVIFETGFLPTMVVCIIWGVSLSSYNAEALKFTRAGNKVSM